MSSLRRTEKWGREWCTGDSDGVNLFSPLGWNILAIEIRRCKEQDSKDLPFCNTVTVLQEGWWRERQSANRPPLLLPGGSQMWPEEGLGQPWSPRVSRSVGSVLTEAGGMAVCLSNICQTASVWHFTLFFTTVLFWKMCMLVIIRKWEI